MSHSYKIQKPITDLASLRQEKLWLRQHIKASDLAMREKVQSWPLTTVLNGAQKVGQVLFQSNLTSMATGLLGFKSGKKGFMPALIKATLLFAGTQLIKQFTKGKSDIEEEVPTATAATTKILQEEELTSAAD